MRESWFEGVVGAGAMSGEAARDVRSRCQVVVVGDQGTGKSSMIIALATDSFPDKPPPVLPPTCLTPDFYPDRVPLTIVDTSSRFLPSLLMSAKFCPSRFSVLWFLSWTANGRFGNHFASNFCAIRVAHLHDHVMQGIVLELWKSMSRQLK